jgi:hypothetical protein
VSTLERPAEFNFPASFTELMLRAAHPAEEPGAL